jgi:murein L,D-transpeptidase YcbB/YkuD
VRITGPAAGRRPAAAGAAHRRAAAGKHIRRLFLAAVLAAAALAGPGPAAGAGDMGALAAAMSEHLVCYPLDLLSHEKQRIAVSSRDLCLASVYHDTGLTPLWVTPEGPGRKAGVVLKFLLDAEAEGLDPENYEAGQIAELFGARDPRSLARLDTLLTFNLIKYVHDVSRGQIRPRQEAPAQLAPATQVDFEPQATIEKALGAPDLAAYLRSLPPAHRHYRDLKRALQTYRNLSAAGGWAAVPAGASIHPGDTDERMFAVVRRLAVTGDLAADTPPVPFYDPLLEPGIKRFQARHGLDPDGVVGRNTLAAMNLPVTDRIRQIIINMTRWRWQEQDLGRKYILVNIANFDLTAFDEGREAFSFPVIVGKLQHQTPIFSDRIIYVEINPYWNVPPSIAVNEELPKLRRDPSYLVKRHIRLFSSWSGDAYEIDSQSVDWQGVSPRRMARYKLRQDPGPWNALGRIKFVFPNHYDVYLHDTPTRNLFSRIKRDFSHGCIRVSDPAGLGAFVLTHGTAVWSPDEIRAIIDEGRRTVIQLPEALPVHITYQTSWVDKNGIIYFNRDIYGRDDKLLRAMFSESIAMAE